MRSCEAVVSGSSLLRGVAKGKERKEAKESEVKAGFAAGIRDPDPDGGMVEMLLLLEAQHGETRGSYWRR